ncbi:ICOS ligand-like [Pelodytes ibericus]
MTKPYDSPLRRGMRLVRPIGLVTLDQHFEECVRGKLWIIPSVSGHDPRILYVRRGLKAWYGRAQFSTVSVALLEGVSSTPLYSELCRVVVDETMVATCGACGDRAAGRAPQLNVKWAPVLLPSAQWQCCYLDEEEVGVRMLRGCTGLAGRFGGSIELPCVLAPMSYPLERLMVYWQKKTLAQDDLIVVALVQGELKDEFQDKRYKGRVHMGPNDSLQEGNFTLHMSSLSWEDDGGYRCIIMITPVVQILKDSTMDLTVTGQFSVPMVTSSVPGQVDYGQEVTLTCMTYGSIKQDTILWLNFSDCAQPIMDRNQRYTQRQGDAINITSAVTVNITSPLNVTCTLYTPAENLTSQACTEGLYGGLYGVMGGVIGRVI